MKKNSDSWIVEILDNDVIGWMNTLREGGLSELEIENFILSHNKTYLEMKFPRKKRIEDELRKTEAHIRAMSGRILSKEQRKHLYDSIASREEFKD